MCVILDSFHYVSPRQWAAELSSRGGALVEAASSSKGAADDSDGEEDEDEAETKAGPGLADPWMYAEDIRSVLQGRVLPCLHSHLVEDEEVRQSSGSCLSVCLRTCPSVRVSSGGRVRQRGHVGALTVFLSPNPTQQAVRTPVAIALVKLLALLPPEVEALELPRTLQVGLGIYADLDSGKGL